MEGLLFAEKFLRVVTAGDHNSTYKMATAIALLQVAQEVGVDVVSAIPSRRVAEVVIDLYSIQLGALDRAETLRQMNRADQSSRILDAVLRLAEAQPKSRPRRPEESAHYEAVVREVEDALLAYPLRLLQPPDDMFLYSVPFPAKRSRAAFGADYGGELRLVDGALQLLQRAGPLLRPLIETAWTEKVARYNGVDLDESRLRRQLFGYERASWPARLRVELEGLQEGCFYCGRPLPRRTAEPDAPSSVVGAATHIDHFVPWARTMNDAVENLVLTDGQCNLRKSDYLCSPAVVNRWIERLRARRTELAKAAKTAGWTT
ncbi:MAG: HNH endonuclease domain-containing protein, partial [Acidimicrobiia bacterium]